MKNKGITMIALIVTIVVLLILAGITIGTLTGENGLIGNSKEAKEQTEIANEKEILEQATVDAISKGKYGNMTKENLQESLDKIIGDKTEIGELGENFEILFLESRRYYQIDKDGNICDYQIAEEDNYPGDITKDKNGNALDGSEEKPYEINCIEDLVQFSKDVNEGNRYSNKNIIVTRNLNFKSDFSYSNINTTQYDSFLEGDGTKGLKEELLEGGTGFMPIGMDIYNMNFGGVFDGKNYTIQEIYINKSRDNTGLFGACTNAEIKNINITGKIKGKGNHCGSIVAIIKGGNIEKCSSWVEIDASCFGTGGIAGMDQYLGTTIKNCHNYGNVTNKGWPTGGIIGNIQQTEGINIINCSNRGKISAEDSRGTAGIVGLLQDNGNIYNCFNIGEIIGKNKVAGVMGCITKSCKIRNIYQIGALSNITQKGEIIGSLEEGATVDSKNIFYKKKDDTVEGIYQKNDIEYNIQGYTELEWNTDSIIQKLNQGKTEIEEGIDKAIWKTWKMGEEGYPTFNEIK